MSSRLKVSFPQGEKLPPNFANDYAWFKENRNALSEKYGSAVVVVYENQLLAVGATYQEALSNAENNLPDSPEIITPIVEFIGNNTFRLRKVRRNEEEV